MKLYHYHQEGVTPCVLDLDHIISVSAPSAGSVVVDTTVGARQFTFGTPAQAADMHRDLWLRWAAREAELAYADNVRNKFFVAATQGCESLEEAREEEAKRWG